MISISSLNLTSAVSSWIKSAFLATTLTASMLTSAHALTVDTPAGKQELPDAPKRIVLLDWGSADTIRYLHSSDKVVGIGKTDYMPQDLVDSFAQTPSVGTLLKPDYETISELKPDLIVVKGYTIKFADELSQIAPLLKVVYDFADPVNSVKAYTEIFGKLLGKEQEAAQANTQLEQSLAQAQAAVAQKPGKTALGIFVRGRAFLGYGPTSDFSLIYKTLGTQPVDPTLGNTRAGTLINYEFLRDKNPDWIFVIDNTKAGQTRAETLDILQNPLTEKVNGLRNGLVILPQDRAFLAQGGVQAMIDTFSAIKQQVQQYKLGE